MAQKHIETNTESIRKRSINVDLLTALLGLRSLFSAKAEMPTAEELRLVGKLTKETVSSKQK
ncbi:MAG: hypothetical protein IJO10_01150 [Clostridia bacterium]|nr:hypothetical protein [Clostridia bacterium]